MSRAHIIAVASALTENSSNKSDNSPTPGSSRSSLILLTPSLWKEFATYVLSHKVESWGYMLNPKYNRLSNVKRKDVRQAKSSSKFFRLSASHFNTNRNLIFNIIVILYLTCDIFGPSKIDSYFEVIILGVNF